MSFLGIHILSDAAVAHLKASGHQVETFAVNEFDKALAAAKQTEIGTAALKAVHAAEDTTLTGPQKLEQAVAAVAPVVVDYVAKGGLSAVISDAETFARSLVESTLADVKQTKVVGIAQAILKLLGLA